MYEMILYTAGENTYRHLNFNPCIWKIPSIRIIMSLFYQKAFKILKTYHFLQVSLTDASKFEKRLMEEVYEKWNENIEIIKMTRIPKREIPAFIESMHKTLEGK